MPHQRRFISTWTHGADRHRSALPGLVPFATQLAPPQGLRLHLCLCLAERRALTAHLAL